MGRVSARSLASAAVLLVWLVLLAPAARAQSGSALTRLAQRIATVTPTTPAFAAVTPLAGVTLAEAERAQLDAKLARVLGSAVTGARGRGATALTEGAARERSRELGLALVLVRPTLAGGLLSVDVDVIEWELSFWARTRKPGGTVVTHASFSEPADTEIRRYLQRPPGLLRSELRFAIPERDGIALACGDVQAPGATELLIVGRRQLHIGALTRPKSGQRGTFAARRSAAWDDLSPLSPHPLRAPLAAAQLTPGTALIGSSDRAASIALSADLAAPRFAEPQLPIAPERCHALTQSGIATASQPCAALTSARPETREPAAATAGYDGVAFLAHTDERGIVRTYELVSSRSGLLTVTIDSPLEERRVVQLPRGGAQVALADLDGDAVVEAITTAPAGAERETLMIHALTDEGAVLVATRSVGPVRALAVCPFDGENPQRLAVLLADEVRVFE